MPNKRKTVIVTSNKLMELIDAEKLNSQAEIYYLRDDDETLTLYSVAGESISTFPLASSKSSPLFYEDALAVAYKGLVKQVGPIDTVVTHPGSRLHLLVNFAKRDKAQNIVVYAFSSTVPIPPTLGSCADSIVSEDQKVRQHLVNKTVYSVQNMSLTTVIASGISKKLVAPNIMPVQSSKQKKVLILSYYASPLSTVGALRTNYWFHNMEEKSSGALKPFLATATPAPRETNGDRLFIPDLQGVQSLENVALRNQQNFLKRFMDVTGYFWCKDVCKYVETHFPKDYFDLVVFSGNPFVPFAFGRHFKKQLGTRVVLDYRDPFSKSPIFKRHPLKKWYLQWLESRWNNEADLITTVNETCKGFVVGSPNKVEVISNGFDEKLVERASPKARGDSTEEIRMVYAGSFNRPHHDPSLLLEALPKTLWNFVHVGRDPGKRLNTFSGESWFSAHGPQSNLETLSHLKAMDVGLVFAGQAFESTTKIYDYLACDLDVLIVHPPGFAKSELHQITEGLSRIYWVENTPTSIRKFFETYKDSKVPRDPLALEKLSRGFQLKKFCKKLLNLS